MFKLLYDTAEVGQHYNHPSYYWERLICALIVFLGAWGLIVFSFIYLEVF